MQEYTGISMPEQEELCVIDFYALLRDAVIYNCLQSQEGKKYLESCWILEQTKPNRQKLRERFKEK